MKKPSLLSLLSSPDYRVRKEARRQQFAENFGKKSVVCTACNGSGRYDHNGSPRCGQCNGTGKTKD
jgi:DnaJ-class molecular chaperone